MVNNKVKAAFAAAVIIGVTAMLAFSNPESPDNALAPQWFEYTGPQFPDEADAKDPDNYQPLGTTCPGSGLLCAIFAEPNTSNPNQPVIQGDQPLETAIEDYVDSGGSNVDEDFIQDRD